MTTPFEYYVSICEGQIRRLEQEKQQLILSAFRREMGILAFCVLCGIVMVCASVFVAKKDLEASWQADAVNRGHAHWERVDGSNVFVWNESDVPK